MSRKFIRYTAILSLLLIAISGWLYFPHTGSNVYSSLDDAWDRLRNLFHMTFAPVCLSLANVTLLVCADLPDRTRFLKAIVMLLLCAAFLEPAIHLWATWNQFSDLESFTRLAVDWAYGLSAAAILGFGLTAMLLGHVDLVNSRLSFEPLVWMSGLFVASVMVRMLVLVLLMAPGAGWPELGDWTSKTIETGKLLRFLRVVRVLIGLGFPLILGVMAYRRAKNGANRSALGLMHVATGFVIIGELCSFFLSFQSPYLE